MGQPNTSGPKISRLQLFWASSSHEIWTAGDCCLHRLRTRAVTQHSFIPPICSAVLPILAAFSFFLPLAAQILTRAALTRRWAPPAAPWRGSTMSRRTTARRRRTGPLPGWVLSFYNRWKLDSYIHPWKIDLHLQLSCQSCSPVIKFDNLPANSRMWRVRTQWQTWRPPLLESSARQTSSEQQREKIKLFYSE